MAEGIYGGANKFTMILRPRSNTRSQNPSRRKQKPSNNTAVFPDPPKPAALQHSASFPLFSSHLVDKTLAKLNLVTFEGISTTNHEGIRHASSTQMSFREVSFPTPMEEVSDLVGGITSLSNSKSDAVSVTHQSSKEINSASLKLSTGITTNDRCQHLEHPGEFPFQFLPDDCILKVFSYLSSHDKGRCAQVCVHWRNLMSTPSIWSHVSFSSFPFWCVTSEEHNCLENCYIRYRTKVKQFMSFLKALKPVLHSLEFKFDIGEYDDGFFKPIEKLIAKANTKDLRYVNMNWTETPMRPFWADMSQNICCDEVVENHRRRQRKFVNFFDNFTKKCQKVETLIVPFDWSNRSVDSLLRLKNLRSLVLEKYFVFQNFCQDLINRLLNGLPNLKYFMLDIWTPGAHGLLFFALVSLSVEHLDISQSRGFYLNSVHLPKMKVFCVARHPWNGPLVLPDRIDVPCIYSVLVEGAPNLEKINEHYLEKNWQDFMYKELEEVLKRVCSCEKHKSGWAMQN